MKKQLFLGVIAICAAAGTVMAQETAKPVAPMAPAASAQPQGMQMKAPNERTKETVLKLQNDLALTGEQAGKVYPIFQSYYTAQQKAMEEMRASGTMDREAMKAGRDKMNNERDEQLKTIFTADQMKKWKDEVEPSMRPQRRGDGNGRQ